MLPVNGPEVMIAGAQERFDEYGNLIDPASKELTAELLGQPGRVDAPSASDNPRGGGPADVVQTVEKTRRRPE
jgi:hypothetical protein